MDPSMLVFLAIVAFVVVVAVWAVERRPHEARSSGSPVERMPRRFAAAWLVLSALPTLLGLMGPVGPIPPQLLFVPIMAGALWLGWFGVGQSIADSVPLHLIVGFQGFRFPLELVLHRWAELGVVPPQMTWTGQNPDIVAGVVALLFVPVVARWRSAAWIPTLVGIALLANVVRVVLTSLPGPLQRFPETILLPSMFPHVWIATVCVAGAVVGHVVAVRALLRPSDVAE